MTRFRQLARTHGFDALVLALALQAVGVLVVRQDAADAPEAAPWLTLPVVTAMAAALLARKRFPFGGPAAFWLVGAAVSFFDGRLVPFAGGLYVLGMAAAFLLGNVRDSLKARLGLLVVLGGAAIVIFNLPDHSAAEQVFVPLVFVASWLAGFAVRERAEEAEAAEARAAEAERDRDLASRIAVAEERARIARELHDVVAHAVSVMVLQVGAVRHKLPPSLSEDANALQGVERTGRAALAEMRRLLGAMRSEGEDLELGPQPGLDSLESLLDTVGRAGLPVELHVEGDRFPLPRAVDLSAYRIVQEGLTNALKHAGASRADVTLAYAPSELRIEVRDDGRGGGGASDGQGHGLVGIRERVTIYGGEMSAGADADGGYVLRARLPLEVGR